MIFYYTEVIHIAVMTKVQKKNPKAERISGHRSKDDAQENNF